MYLTGLIIHTFEIKANVKNNFPGNTVGKNNLILAGLGPKTVIKVIFRGIASSSQSMSP